MKILVTGSAGHLGEALMRTLKNTDHEAVGMDIITSPFTDRIGSVADREHVKKCRAAAYEAIYSRLGWKMFPQIGRGYDNTRAREELGWSPKHDFKSILSRLKNGDPPQSRLARLIGLKGYHDQEFSDGPYPVN